MDRLRESKALWVVAIIVIVALIVVVIVLAVRGCGGKEEAPATRPTTTPRTQPATTPTAQPTAPVVLTGSGTSDTQVFTLRAGLAVFQIRNSTVGTFTATLMDPSGKQVSVLANTNNPFNGSTALGATAGQYKIHVISSGSWEINIAQGVPVTPQFIPLYASGDGPQVTAYFQSSGANATVTMNYTGTTSPFLVTLMTSNGETITELANQQTGPFSGQKTVLLEQGVVYIIDVEAGGPWTLQVQ